MSQLTERFVDVANELKKAVAHHQSGNLKQAEAYYQKILAYNPDHPDALHLLGVAAHQKGESDAAVVLIKKAIRSNRNNPFYYNNLGAAFLAIGAQDEAVINYRKALQLKPDYAEAAYNMGSVLLLAGNLLEAVSWYEKAIKIKPNYLDAYTNLAASYNLLNKSDEALVCCHKALKLNPDSAEALNNMGNALMARGKQQEAIACFQRSTAVDPANAEAYTNMGNAFHDLGRPEEAVDSYRRAIKQNPRYGQAYNYMGIVFREQGRLNEALFCYQKATQLIPDDPEAYHNIGNVYKDQGKLNEAAAMYRRAIDRNPQLADSYVNLGTALEEQGRSSEAVSSYLKALDLQPEHSKAYSHLVHQLQSLCAWEKLGPFSAKLDELTAKALDEGKKPDEGPFLNLTRHADPARNYKVAKAWSDEISGRIASLTQFHPIGKNANQAQRRKETRIRVGYLSNNFKNHPTAHLIQGMFRHYNREKFETCCYSYGEDDKSNFREKIKKECDRFIDIRTLNHIDAARRIYDDRVDILVDLVGYMKANRLCIPALRPAPVQVRWLGLAGTTGANFFDYLIADELVVPESHARFYSETLVHMPDCYQINDNTQGIADRGPKGEDVGLPKDGFVFCCFCSRYKIEPVMFASWMKILKQVSGSVLWILGGSTAAEKNIQQAAERQGIDAKRIFFAKKLPREDHLARLRFAHLALDTRIVNGAITTSDALWSGVPVITLQGSHFASRMSASILSAAGLPQMVTYSMGEYVALAVRLARHPQELNAIRQKLSKNRFNLPLFDTKLFVRNLELALERMWKIYRCGDTPLPIRVGEISAQMTEI